MGRVERRLQPTTSLPSSSTLSVSVRLRRQSRRRACQFQLFASPTLLPHAPTLPSIDTMVNQFHHYEQYGFSTKAIHVGSEPDAVTGAVIPAISLSTTYKQDSVGVHKACTSLLLFHLQRGSDQRSLFQGYEYSRSDNPNRRALETQLAILEGGEHGLAFASGSAATATVFNALGPGSHVVSVNDVYGGTFRYMSRVAKENQGV